MSCVYVLLCTNVSDILENTVLEITANDPRYVSFSSAQVPLQFDSNTNQSGTFARVQSHHEVSDGLSGVYDMTMFESCRKRVKNGFLFPVWKRCSCCTNVSVRESIIQRQRASEEPRVSVVGGWKPTIRRGPSLRNWSHSPNGSEVDDG